MSKRLEIFQTTLRQAYLLHKLRLMLQRNLLALFVLAMVLIVACQTNTRHYQPEDLRKLSGEEILARARQKHNFSPYAVFKDSLGLPLSDEYKEKLDRGELTYDYYANAQNEVVELVVRTPNYEDDLLNIQKKAALSGLTFRGSREPVEVSCRAKKQILTMIYKRKKEAQAIRDTINAESYVQEGGSYSIRYVDGQILHLQDDNPYPMLHNMSLENEDLVIKLLEECSLPSKREVGEAGMKGLFFTIHESSPRFRALYYDIVKQCVDNGDLKKKNLAILEDRMMRDYSKKQLYGSQLKKDRDTEVWTLYPVRDPENLDKRRKKMGLEPIEDYLKSLEIEYDLAGEIN